MTAKKNSHLRVIENPGLKNLDNIANQDNFKEFSTDNHYHTNIMYEKLLNFRNLQEKQKKRFSVDDLFKLC